MHREGKSLIRLFLSRRASRRPSGKNRGSILFLAVGAIAVLTILATGASSVVSQEWKLASFLTDANTSFYDALSTIRVMKQIWVLRSSPLVMSFYDLRTRDLAFGEKVVTLVCYDEQALVPIAHADRSTLLQLPGIVGNEALLNAILATPLYVKEDLLSAEGVTEDVYGQLKGVVTIYGAGRVNINTAAAEAMTAMGAPQALVVRIQQYRAGIDGFEGTADDGVFSDVYHIADVLEPYGLTAAERQWIETTVLAQQLTTGSSAVRFDMTVKKGKKTLRHFLVTVDISTGVILRWDEQ